MEGGGADVVGVDAADEVCAALLVQLHARGFEYRHELLLHRRCLAVVGGTAQRIYEAGGCGYGVQITRGNTVWLYCHGKGTYYVNNGATVNTGARIMLSGNTGSSTGPHLHIQVKINGVKRCPQPLLVAAWRGQTYDPQNMPTSGCTS